MTPTRIPGTRPLLSCIAELAEGFDVDAAETFVVDGATGRIQEIAAIAEELQGFAYAAATR